VSEVGKPEYSDKKYCSLSTTILTRSDAESKPGLHSVKRRKIVWVIMRPTYMINSSQSY